MSKRIPGLFYASAEFLLGAQRRPLKGLNNPLCRNFASETRTGSQFAYKFDSLKVTKPIPSVYQIELNKEQSGNALNSAVGHELRTCFEIITHDQSCRAVVLSGAGKDFCLGINIADLSKLDLKNHDHGRNAFRIRTAIKQFQDSFTAIEKCPKPVIAAVTGGCLGAGVDLISACDIRYCTKDSYFAIKQVDMALAADLGSIQRLPRIIGNGSMFKEFLFTGRNFSADEASKMGLVNRVVDDRNSLLKDALDVAKNISDKSPLAISATKINLNFARDHSVQSGLEFNSVWNMSMIQGYDLREVFKASLEGREPKFYDLH